MFHKTKYMLGFHVEVPMVASATWTIFSWIASEWMIVHMTKAHAANIVSSIPSSHSNRGLALQRCCEAGAKMSCSDGTQ